MIAPTPRFSATRRGAHRAPAYSISSERGVQWHPYDRLERGSNYSKLKAYSLKLKLKFAKQISIYRSNGILMLTRVPVPSALSRDSA